MIYVGSLILSIFISSNTMCEERPGKAVFEYSVESGMKLTEKALKNIEVKTTKVSSGSQQAISANALVYFQDQIGVYRLRNGWFKLVKVQLIKKGSSEVVIQSPELGADDEVAIHGADLLRVSEMDAAGGGE